MSSACVVSVLIQALFRSEENNQETTTKQSETTSLVTTLQCAQAKGITISMNPYFIMIPNESFRHLQLQS